ncbi:chaperone modulator CbpM [Taklimakanibacter deserti]|uniref:chaperone modulator CbpM n=1 Tax=Taklimakanibacter deserti TaxID=2267839 RepID=UPI0034D54721
MVKKTTVFVTARYDEEMLRTWAAAGWISIEESQVGEPLSEVDTARCNLICDLKHDIGVNDEGIDVILNLLDQIHGLRRALRETLGDTKRR